MKRPVSSPATRTQARRKDAGSVVPPLQREQRKEPKQTETGFSRYASPPCYLAEFADAEWKDLTAQ
ncbi:hypothetical protein [Prosthecobacter sp.]|uniref:hypothetical protein n=1 Tax=Prosthecobacter sp. TaxID=1965333 RepID=UPI0037844ABF